MENPIKMDDLGVPLFLETPIYEIEPAWNLKNDGAISSSWIIFHSEGEPGIKRFRAMKKRAPGCLGFIGDDILPNAGITINHEIRIPIQQPCKDYNEAIEFGSENSAEMRPPQEKEFVSLCHLFF